MNTNSYGTPEEKPVYDVSDSRQISGKAVFLILLLTLVAFFGVSMIFFSMALEQVLTRMYDDTITVEQMMADQPRILDSMLRFIQEGVSVWPAKMKVTWVINQAVIIFPVLIFLRKRKLPVSAHLRLRPVPPSFYGQALLIGVAFTVVGDELTRMVDMIKPIPDAVQDNLYQMLSWNNAGDFITIFLTLCIAAPLVEEALFRGFLQRWFEQNRGVTSGVLATSALFALVHANLYFLIPILLLAIILGAMAWRVESILPSMIVHAVNNSFGLIGASVYGKEDPAWYTLGEHVAPWWFIGAVVILYFTLRAFFRTAEELKIGGHGPHGSSGANINLSV